MTGEAERRAALEEQRRFLLASLRDLERERAAGDVDEADYAALEDDYTARAASVIRALGSEDQAPAKERPSGRGRRFGLVAAVVLFAVAAGILVAQTAGRRDPGDVITGDVRQSITEKLNEAGRLGSEGDYASAVALYDEVLADEPDHPEALTYQGWLLSLSGEEEAGLDALLAAATAHPDYPDVHAFLAVVFFRNGLVEQAGRELDRLDALDPPAAIRQLTEPLRAQVDSALRATSTTAGDQAGGGT